MDSIVMVAGAVVLIGMVVMLVKTAKVIHQAPRPEGEPHNSPESDKDKSS